MKLTKKQEAEIRQVMNTYWDSYIRGDLKTWASFLPDNYRNIGTNQEENWSNKKEIVEYTRRVTYAMAGKADLRNKKTEIIPYDPYIMVHEHGDLYVETDEGWILYAPLRLSSLIEKTNTGWKVLHQHGSYPDAHVEQGEPFAFDKLKKENERLRKAVQKRTQALEETNQELKIESALERVRAVAMGMKTREDMLRICETIARELGKLGVQDIRNVQTAIFYPKRGTYMNYEYYARHKKTFITETSYTNSRVHQAFAVKMLKGKGEFFKAHIRGEEKLREWVAYQKTTNVFIDRYLLKAQSLNYYWHSLGPVALGISTYNPLSKADLALFHRFLKVFELSYRRYLDIEKAEAQAREAQIQLALERVRARAMAMQQSGELADLVSVLFRELTSLGFNLAGTIIWMYKENPDHNAIWIASPEMNKPPRAFDIKPFFADFFQSVYKAWKIRDPHWSYTLRGARKKKFQEAFIRETPGLPVAFKQALTHPDEVIFTASFNHFGALEVVSTEPLTEDKIDLLHRFGRVFDLSYTRFNDLKQAEAQAREAQIQLALERVRARTMAMNRSEELKETVYLLLQQFRELGDYPEQMTIGIMDEREPFVELFLTMHGHPFDQSVKAPVSEPYVISKMYKGWKAKKSSILIDISGAALTKYNRFRNQLVKGSTPGSSREKRRVIAVAFFSKGGLSISSDREFNSETVRILERFAGVFEQTYTRFLDLKKAEAQAREAEIQLALERVRARTMSMHKSGELSDVSALLYNQLQRLGVTRFINCGYVEIDEAANIQHAWMTNADGSGVHVVKMPLTGDVVFADRYHAWKKGEKIFRQSIGGDILKNHIEYATQHYRKTEIDKMVRSRFADPTVFYCANFFHGYLHIVTDTLLSEEEESLLSRFTAVFEMTYKRFLDLQSAETQAREAQIEVALERVRARTMAMQKSDELADTSYLLFQQFEKLGFKTEYFSIGIMNEPEEVGEMYATIQGNKQLQQRKISIHEPIAFKKVYAAWKQQRKTLELDITGDELQAYNVYRNKVIGRKIFPEVVKESDRWVNVCAYFTYGLLSFAGSEAPPPEMLPVLLRFAKVFEQTYTRFLDLQKAEAQAKESRIQLAMERVRAAASAMHKSDELTGVVSLLYQQLEELDFGLYQVLISIINTNREHIEWWSRGFDEVATPQCYIIPFVDHPFPNQQLQRWKSGQTYHAHKLGGALKRSWDEYLFTHTELRNFPEPVKQQMRELDHVFLSDAYMKHGVLQAAGATPLPAEKAEILKRFASVLDQAYTRMMDLHKAETQAREAQIQLALERVRARTMAMQKSEELKEAASVLYKELRSLDIGNLVNCGYVFIDEKNNLQHAWMTHEDGSIREAHTMPLTGDKIMNERYEKWKKGVHLFSQKLGGKELKKHHEFVISQQKKATENNKGLSQLPDPVIFYCGNFSKGYLHILCREELMETSESILYRFAKVFEQTYTRFLDLQKVEAQAREAQIETALERIRARALAMHQSDELKDVARVLREQMGSLGQPELETSAVHLYEEDPENILSWRAFRLSSDLEGKISYGFFKIPKKSCEVAREFTRNFKSDQSAYTIEIKGAKQKEWYQVLFNLAPEVKKAMEESGSTEDTRYYHFSKFSGGALLLVASRKPSNEAMELQKRSAQVFDLAYRRFKDLQKAEAQAREARIETALEKVRSRSIGMQKSDELKDVIRVVFDQLVHLEIQVDHAGFVVDYSPGSDWNFWIADKQQIPSKISHPYFDSVWARQFDEAKEMGIDFFTTHLSFDEKNKFYNDLLQYIPDLPEESRAFYFNCPGLAASNVLMTDVALYIENFSGTPYSEEENRILMRFGKVFQQTYTRFLDLKKAEAQARESQIEAALEKVRSRTMAMQSSNELQETAAVLFQEFKKLGIEEIFQVTIGIYNEAEKLIDFRVTNWDGSGKHEDRSFNLDMDEPTVLKPTVIAWKEKRKSMVIDLSGEALEGWLNYRNKMSGVRISSADSGGRRVISIAFYSRGHLSISSPVPVPDETMRTLERFAAVFDATYTRFLDLKKAEAQAREAQIEAALERVRSNAMAMHNSEDIAATVDVFFRELKNLGITPIRCGVGQIDKDTRTSNVSATTSSKQGDSYEVMGKLKLEGHPVLDAIFAHWENQKEYYPILKGEELTEYYRTMNPQVGFPDYPAEAVQYGSYFYFKEGLVFAWTEEPLTTEAVNIFRRFTSVITLSYRRYMDLREAEAQAREALIEAALERVRSRSLAMRSADELEEVTHVLREEMGRLNQRELESAAIHLYPEGTDDIEWWGAFQIPGKGDGLTHIGGRLSRHSVKMLSELYGHYASGEREYTMTVDLSTPEMAEYLALMVREVPEIMDALDGELPERAWWNGAAFSGGAIITITYVPPTEELLDLQRRAANTFEIAYRRFVDLQKAQAETQRVLAERDRAEAALKELRATQSQLIQSEKMASLGELTAGIAHEIQNPLNFVNNFSEVSNELIGEMLDEIGKGNFEFARKIAEDVRQNLDKIHFHGERAGGIVKGMLQHSRSSSGQKEPTDINALCDEYLRLAFHGLRARDKSFSAKFESQFDPSVGKIPVVSQDIGRVVLNLINNAFYAVAEKKKSAAEGFEPMVTVFTCKDETKVEIKVKDNGSGIPESVLEKIFQPFFTTKPTGQGTGLGLSLSYDIVKAHGGEIKVKSKEGEGTEFIIQLPIV
ncbi:MAG: ATP-binding protein [Chitinophagaceae bacterium]